MAAVTGQEHEAAAGVKDYFPPDVDSVAQAKSSGPVRVELGCGQLLRAGGEATFDSLSETFLAGTVRRRNAQSHRLEAPR